jgi:hypothetical protein
MDVGTFVVKELVYAYAMWISPNDLSSKGHSGLGLNGHQTTRRPASSKKDAGQTANERDKNEPH